MVFLFDLGTVPTVWYFMFDFGIVPTVWYFMFDFGIVPTEWYFRFSFYFSQVVGLGLNYERLTRLSTTSYIYWLLVEGTRVHR